MSFGVTKIGVTGPSARIGGSSDYHIDTKFSNQLSFEQIRDRMDALARKYQSEGRNIEFSNQGVADLVYDLNASPEERLALLQKAAGAHAPREGWHSFDYYAPLAGTNRWDKSAEGAPIYVVGATGLNIEGGSGGGYGNYGVVLDKDGRVLSKSGHGDNSQTMFAGGVLGGDGSVTATPTVVDGEPVAPVVQAKERAKTYAEMSKAEINAEYDRLRKDSPATAAEEGLKMHQAFFSK